MSEKFVGTRTMRTAVAAVACMLMLSPGPAAAQVKPEAYLGSRITVSPEEIKQKELRRILAEFATCVIKKRHALASAYILDRSVFTFEQKYGRLADGDCLQPTNALAPGMTLKLDDESMRYALAEAVLRNEITTIDPGTLSSAPQIPTPVVYDYSNVPNVRTTKADKETPEERRAAALAKVVMYKFGDCAVRAAPTAARALLQAAPASSAEGSAIQSLRPALGSCLEKGAQVTLNRIRLRGAIAVSYYSLAHASPAGTTKR